MIIFLRHRIQKILHNHSVYFGNYSINTLFTKNIKVGLSPSKFIFTGLNESPFKMMKTSFYFILKAFFRPQDILNFSLDFLVM